MIKAKTKNIVKNIYKWFMKKSLVILFIILGYIAMKICNDGEFFGTTLFFGILFLLVKEDEEESN